MAGRGAGVMPITPARLAPRSAGALLKQRLPLSITLP